MPDEPVTAREPGTRAQGGLTGSVGKRMAIPFVLVIAVGAGLLVWWFSRRGQSTAAQQAVAQQGYPNPTGTADVSANEIAGLQMQMSNLGAMLNNQYQALANQNQPASAAPQPGQPAPPASQAPPVTPPAVPPGPTGSWGQIPGYIGYSYSQPDYLAGGYEYFHLENPAAATAYQQQYGAPYYFAAPGVPVQGPPAGTVQYGRIPAPMGGGGAGGDRPVGMGGAVQANSVRGLGGAVQAPLNSPNSVAFDTPVGPNFAMN